MDSVVVKSKKEIKESSKGTEDELESDKLKKAESDKEKAKGSRKKMLGRKRAGKEQQQESSKNQRMEEDKESDEVKEVEEDDEAELKKHLVIKKDEDIAIDAIPLATKPPVIDGLSTAQAYGKAEKGTIKGNSQVKDNKIDLLVQQYEQFTILKEESIDSGFARFNTIITSLKALDEGFSGKNYVRKFLRALHPKWRAKVMTIEESKDLSSLALDELIDNLKVHEVVMEKDSKIYRVKKERVKSIALKAKK
ncbi:hypothetical protein Tco_0839885 [Tanacetum coccineum]|uniref:UBN2 domain-containing protein n=1 Tax=Tanacetum coccineum TaxID=301880 RepID=A0ABQ5ASU1_9ASTR